VVSSDREFQLGPHRYYSTVVHPTTSLPVQTPPSDSRSPLDDAAAHRGIAVAVACARYHLVCWGRDLAVKK